LVSVYDYFRSRDVLDIFKSGCELRNAKLSTRWREVLAFYNHNIIYFWVEILTSYFRQVLILLDNNFESGIWNFWKKNTTLYFKEGTTWNSSDIADDCMERKIQISDQFCEWKLNLNWELRCKNLIYERWIYIYGFNELWIIFFIEFTKNWIVASIQCKNEINSSAYFLLFFLSNKTKKKNNWYLRIIKTHLHWLFKFISNYGSEDQTNLLEWVLRCAFFPKWIYILMLFFKLRTKMCLLSMKICKLIGD